MPDQTNIPARSPSRKIPAPESANTQRGRILRLLIEARGGWVPSPEIAACAQQYNARLFELRRLNFQIENRVEEVNGTRLSWFRLIPGPGPVQVEPATPPDADRDDVDPQPIPPKPDPREQLQLFSPKEDLR